MALIRNFFCLFCALAIVAGCAEQDKKTTPIKRGFRKQVECVRVKTPEEIIVRVGDERFTISLLGLETPPENAKMYNPAMEFLKRLEGRKLVVETVDEMKQGHVAAFVFYKAQHKPVARFGSESEYTVDLNQKMIELGLARFNSDKVPERYRKSLEASEMEAREGRYGIWQQP